jgi:hypothetical protein
MSYKLMLDMFYIPNSTQKKGFNILIVIFFLFDIIFTLKYYKHFFVRIKLPYFIP